MSVLTTRKGSIEINLVRAGGFFFPHYQKSPE